MAPSLRAHRDGAILAPSRTAEGYNLPTGVWCTRYASGEATCVPRTAVSSVCQCVRFSRTPPLVHDLC